MLSIISIFWPFSLQKEFKPHRYFSIDRVFRNETLDATHLAEFHQVEGVFADYGLNLGHLKAVIRAFFAHLGLSHLRFKPAYNPYTEPSMEIFGFHPGKLPFLLVSRPPTKERVRLIFFLFIQVWRSGWRSAIRAFFGRRCCVRWACLTAFVPSLGASLSNGMPDLFL